eukprot:394097-Pleurochrysis_carterae.AAC.2
MYHFVCCSVIVSHACPPASIATAHHRIMMADAAAPVAAGTTPLRTPRRHALALFTAMLISSVSAFEKCSSLLTEREELPTGMSCAQRDASSCARSFLILGAPNTLLKFYTCQWQGMSCIQSTRLNTCTLTVPANPPAHTGPTTVPPFLAPCGRDLRGKINIRVTGETVHCFQQTTELVCARSYMAFEETSQYRLCTWQGDKCRAAGTEPSECIPLAPPQTAVAELPKPVATAATSRPAATVASPAATVASLQSAAAVQYNQQSLPAEEDGGSIASLLMYAAGGMLALALVAAATAYWYTQNVGGKRKCGDDGKDDDGSGDDDETEESEEEVPAKKGRGQNKGAGKAGIPKRALKAADREETQALQAVSEKGRGGKKKAGGKKSADYSMDDDDDQYSAV